MSRSSKSSIRLSAACGVALLVTALTLIAIVPARARNLLTNGSFTVGNTDFNTDYANYYNGTTARPLGLRRQITRSGPF